MRQLIVSSNSSKSSQMNDNSEASGSHNLSTTDGRRSSMSSDDQSSSSKTLAANLNNLEDQSWSADVDYTADENMSNHDGKNKALSNEADNEGTLTA